MNYFIGINSDKCKHNCFIIDHNGEVINNTFTFKNDKTHFSDFYSIIKKLYSRKEIYN